MGGLSIYFYTGDFNEVLRRHHAGENHGYASHGEVAELLCELSQAAIETTVYSFVTPARKSTEPLPGVRVVDLGASRYDDDDLLVRAIASDTSEAIVPHFPNRAMLRAAARSGKRAAAFLASSFYRRHPRSWYERWRLAMLLNDSAFEIVANHCRPATEHLAELGVRADKLIPYDFPHRHSPAETSAKSLREGGEYALLYVGAITAAKGVEEVLRALRIARDRGLRVRCDFAGDGLIEQMRHLARELGVDATFLGQVQNERVFDLMQAADGIVVPSRREFQEGLPLVMFEAVASHTPIVCSDHPIFAKFMTDGVGARVFKSGSPHSLARAIEALLADPEDYRRLSSQAGETWKKLGGTADWRTLVRTWFAEGPNAPWIEERKLSSH